MKRTITGALLLFGSLAANAANPGRTYDAPFDKVWTACVQAASEKYVVTHSEKESGILSFEQGPSWKSNSWGTEWCLGNQDQRYTDRSHRSSTEEASSAIRELRKYFQDFFQGRRGEVEAKLKAQESVGRGVTCA